MLARPEPSVPQLNRERVGGVENVDVLVSMPALAKEDGGSEALGFLRKPDHKSGNQGYNLP